jgi:chromosome partitioning protein
MRRIALINQKGGVGKTTTTVNLGAALALAGKRVVLVDLDPQANLTLYLGLELPADAPSSYRVLTGEVSFGAALRETNTPNLRVLPTDIHLSGAELELSSAEGREGLLRDALEAWRKEHRARHRGEEPADYVLFDCPPSLGLLSLNALSAADEVFLVVQTQFLALQGMSRLVEVIDLVKQRLHPGLRLSGIVPCMYDSRMRLAREVLSELRRYFPAQVFRTPISSNVKLAESPSFGKTIFEYAPESIGARDFASLSHEVLTQAVLGRSEAMQKTPAAPPAPAAARVAPPQPPSAPAAKPAAPVTPAAPAKTKRLAVLAPLPPPAAPASAPVTPAPAQPTAVTPPAAAARRAPRPAPIPPAPIPPARVAPPPAPPVALDPHVPAAPRRARAKPAGS